MEDLFLELLKVSIIELRNGKLPKGKFIGKYMDALKQKTKELLLDVEKTPEPVFKNDIEGRIAKYVYTIKKKNVGDTLIYKHPQIVSNTEDPKNNWLDYVFVIPEEEFEYFKTSIVEN